MRSLINTSLATSTAVAAGGAIPVGNVVHKYGNNISASGTTVVIKGAGYHMVTVDVSIEPTAAADMTLNIVDNGLVIATGTATPSAAGDSVSISLQAVIYKTCGCSADNISVVAGAAGTVTNMSVVAERV